MEIVSSQFLPRSASKSPLVTQHAISMQCSAALCVVVDLSTFWLESRTYSLSLGPYSLPHIIAYSHLHAYILLTREAQNECILDKCLNFLHMFCARLPSA